MADLPFDYLPYLTAADILLLPEEGKGTVDHSSSAHPDLNRSLGVNWVERVGGFPPGNWIYRAAKHMVADEGMSVSRAIATAVNAAKKMCATADTNWPGAQTVNPKSQAEACAAVAQWEAMKAKA